MEIVITQPVLQGTKNNLKTRLDTQEDYSLYEPVEIKEIPFEIFKYAKGYLEFRKQIRSNADDGWEWFSLGQWAQQLSLQSAHQDLLALEHLKDIWRRSGVVYYQHQLDAASKVIHKLHGRAILADEVGLGKTIEAGLILKEYILRKLVRKVLILTPASLCRQWQQELREKFGITAWIARRQYDWLTNDILIASIDLAKQEKHKNFVLENNYDLLIVDEAHKLKNERTKNWQLVNAISSKYLLLLTATPVQNNLKELYNLITLLKPGQLGTYREFKKTYVQNDRQPKNSANLRSLLKQVMIRNCRTDGGINLPRRITHSIPVRLSDQEWELYDAISSYIRKQASRYGLQSGLPLITLQREICSSPMAAAVTLARMHQKSQPDEQPIIFSLLEKAVAIENPTKAKVCLDLIQAHKDKVIVFTEYRATLQYLLNYFSAQGFKVVGFDGSLSASRKQWVAHLFQKGADIMVSTESGGEGLNFQFCNAMINYDLPWNPLRLEQRIGRIHRLGQTRNVHVYNLSTTGTVEAHLLNLLDEKIDMFNMVVGELESLFGSEGALKSFEKEIANAIIKAKNDAEVKENLETVGHRVEEKRKELEGQKWII